MELEKQIAENHRLREQIEQLTKRVEQSEKALEICKKDHNNVSSRIIAAQEEERKRMALELHDVLGKSLTAIKFSVENVIMTMTRWGNRESRIQLENVVSIIQDTIKETRDLTAALWPPVLADLGIVATISWYSREFEKIYPWVFVTQNIDVQENQIQDEIKIVIFRILQEAMNNSIKHSGCKNITITLQKICDTKNIEDRPLSYGYLEELPLKNISNRGNGIIFAVSDDGKGFTPPRNTNDSYSLCSIKSSREEKEDNCSKFGLLSMKERCRLSGGTLEIESLPDAGTTIRAFWSIDNLS
ncbi:MAG: hypothetical protein HQK63_01915 [Desulfamplus sp.]|nr:hypothetical protein [Desulfamplus sp.]